MSAKDDIKGGTNKAGSDRSARLAAALRENLRRRKAQKTGRQARGDVQDGQRNQNGGEGDRRPD